MVAPIPPWPKVFAAIWTYGRFAFQDRIKEIKELLELIAEIDHEAFLYLGLVRKEGKIEKEKTSSDLTKVFHLVFTLSAKQSSALYINKKAKNKLRELVNYATSELLLSCVSPKSADFREIQARYRKLADEFKKEIPRYHKFN